MVEMTLDVRKYAKVEGGNTDHYMTYVGSWEEMPKQPTYD
jgi:hypothetical protein